MGERGWHAGEAGRGVETPAGGGDRPVEDTRSVNSVNVSCRILLLGGLRIEQPGTGRVVSRFPTARTAALLGYLALHSPARRTHPREALTELLWPGAEPVAGRNRFKQALSALRRLLEPPGTPRGAVLVADTVHVGLDPAHATTDV